MSYRENLIKLLKKEVKAPILNKEKQVIKRAKSVKKSVLNNAVSKKKRRKYKKGLKKNQSKSIEDYNLFSSTLEKYEKNGCSSSNECSADYSDSDVEINVSMLNMANWTDRIETNITPSKSEHMNELLTNEAAVDTIYHIGNDNTNHIFSMSEESDCQPEEEEHELTLTDDRLEAEESGSEGPQCMNCYVTNHGKVLLLKDRKPIYLHGNFKLSVLHGNLSILGHNLTPSSNQVEVYSLRGFSYLFLQNIHDGGFAKTEHLVKNELRKHGISKTDVLSILSEWNPNDTIAVCTELKNLKLPYIEKHISQKLLPANDECVIIEVKDEGDVNAIRCDPHWDTMTDMIDKNSRIMICGGKGVGKSTLLKYMINQLLGLYDSVLVIDLDPGQPEFTVPGCVSGVIVREPIFGPSFTHLQKPERCIFVENIDVSMQPDLYIKCVIELLKQCKSITGMPTLINYMGFTQSYGINIASTLITHCSPTMVVQINSTQPTKNFEKDLTHKTVLENIEMFGAADGMSDLSYFLFMIDSMADGLTSWQAQGRLTREMCVLSYFSTIVDDSLSLTSRGVPLYKIFLKDITLVCNCSGEIMSKATVFNASLVVLCSLTDTDDVYNCYGWGIIRGIDEEIIILITPVKEDVLENVTHLVIGSVTLPASILMHEDKNVGLIPYVSLGCRTSFNYIPKRSYLPKKN